MTTEWNTQTRALQAWKSVHKRLQTGECMTIPKVLAFPHPREAGARPTVTWPVGQIADYALDFERGVAPLLVREFTDRFDVALMGIRLAERTLALAEANPAAALFVGSGLVGAAIGAAVTRQSNGALLGAGVGILVAILLNAHMSQAVRSEYG